MSRRRFSHMRTKTAKKRHVFKIGENRTKHIHSQSHNSYDWRKIHSHTSQINCLRATISIDPFPIALLPETPTVYDGTSLERAMATPIASNAILVTTARQQPLLDSSNKPKSLVPCRDGFQRILPPLASMKQTLNTPKRLRRVSRVNAPMNNDMNNGGW